MKKISLIIPIYNCAEFLDDCFSSIINQTFKTLDLEVVLVNDGSKDDSAKICKKYAKKYDWLFIDRKENKGLSYTRNEGISNSTGKYIVFLDSDDYLYKNALQCLYNTIEREKSDIVVSKLNAFNSSGEYGYYSDKFLSKNYTFTLEQNSDIINCVSVCGKIYKKSLLNNIKFIENAYHEDNYFSLSAFMKAKKISVLSQYTYYRRIREGDNKSIMQNLNLKTFRDLLKNFDLVLKENPQKRMLCNFAWKKSNNYIINNINKKERKQACIELRHFIEENKIKETLSYYDYLYNIIYYYIGNLYSEVLQYVKKIKR